MQSETGNLKEPIANRPRCMFTYKSIGKKRKKPTEDRKPLIG